MLIIFVKLKLNIFSTKHKFTVFGNDYFAIIKHLNAH